MDVYTTPPPPPAPASAANDTNNNNINYFPIDDLLDFSNDDLYSFSAATTTAAAANSSSSSAATLHHLPLSHQPSSILHHFPSSAAFNPSTDFSYHISVPNDDAAELEWLSQFVDDSSSYYPSNSFITGTINVQSSSTTKARSKRSRGAAPAPAPAPVPSISVAADTVGSAAGRLKPAKKEVPASPTAEGGERRCTHCASEKTPQWRTGPLGPKTLCNACGVRYKSGRLVPEYRPAASPTFVLTQHSNSHRKVLELRRQKELLRQQQQETFYHHRQQQEQQQHHHHHNFGVC